MDGLVLLARSEFSYGTVFAVSFFLCGHTLDDVKHVTVIGPDGKRRNWTSGATDRATDRAMYQGHI